jgi:N6-adenosine-specific RNA methylase IME4
MIGNMGAKMSDERLTRLTGSMLAAVRDQVECLINRGDVDQAQLKVLLNPEARKLAIEALRAQGKKPEGIAKQLGVDRATVYRDLAVASATSKPKNSKENNNAIVADATATEHLSPLDAVREEARAEIEIANEALAAVEVLEPILTFETVVLDPPWPMAKIERDVRPNQVAFDYPTMSEDELRKFSEALNRMAAGDCHLFMWTTQRFLPLALELVAHYGFRYVLTMVWHKAGGYQPTGLPQFNCEFVVYARKGAPKFVSTQGFFCCLNGPRREHSRKPDEFYEMIRLVTGGPRIDVFSREAREGFAQYGNETAKFAEAAQ